MGSAAEGVPAVPSPAGTAPAGASERSRRAQASRVAAIVAVVVFALGLVLLVANGVGADDPAEARKSTTATEEIRGGGKPDSTKKTVTTEVSTPASDESLVGRAFGGGAVPILFQLLVTGVAAFAAGALVQRVMLGEYGITVGPVSLPTLPVIEEDTAAEAVEQIRESPEIAALLRPGPRGPQPFPQFQSVEDDRLALLSIRIELEEKLRALAQEVGVDRDVSLRRLPNRLAQTGVIEYTAAEGLRKLVDIGDRIAAGAAVEPNAAEKIRNQAFSILYALGELRRRARETTSA